MKKTIPSLIILLTLWGGGNLRAVEKWEGRDSFDGEQKWKKTTLPGREFTVREGRLAYSAYESIHGNAAYWWWGNPKAATPIPTDRSWEIAQEVIFPATSPNPTYYDAGIGLVLYADKTQQPGNTRYRAVWVRLRGFYIYNTLAAGLSAESDFNFEVRNGEDGGGDAEAFDSVLTELKRLTLVFRHDALSRTDSFQVKDPNTGEVLYQRNGPSTLSQAGSCLVGPWMSVDDDTTWPAGATYLAADNWVLRSITPDPIDLIPKNGTSSKGIAYSVVVTGLAISGSKLAGTVAITVGSASATLPIRGSIDKNGYFALTAKGTGANKGFGCVLLYDVGTGTYRSNKNTVSAPKQKAIRF